MFLKSALHAAAPNAMSTTGRLPSKLEKLQAIDSISIFFLIARNRDFGGKLTYNNFFKWLFTYCHILFRISRQTKIEKKNGSIERKDIESDFMQITLHK